MEKEELVKKITKSLDDENFQVVVTKGVRSNVDIIAKRKEQKVMLKVVKNVDAVNRNEANNLYKLAFLMGSKPIIVGLVSQNGRLNENTYYSRFSIQCVEADALPAALSQDLEYFASKNCSIKVFVDSKRLRTLRKLKGLTRSELAKEANVSLSTIYKHETSYGFASKDVVEAIEKVLGAGIKMHEAGEEEPKQIKTNSLGRSNVKFAKLDNMPFGMIAKEKNYYPIGLDSDSRTMRKKALLFKALKNSFDDNFPFFVSRKEGRIEGIRVVEKSKLYSISSEEDLLDLVY